MLTNFGKAVIIAVLAMCMIIIIISTRMEAQRHNDIMILAETSRQTDLEIIKYNEEVLEYNTEVARRNAELHLKQMLER
jgi:hypothetical protein